MFVNKIIALSYIYTYACMHILYNNAENHDEIKDYKI